MSKPSSADRPSGHQTIVHEGRDAVRRLSDLGIADEMLVRAASRADADAVMCTPLDPPNLEGIIRWGRFVRYLREELIPLGWDWDNSKNFCRVVSPDRTFAIVVSSGDDLTGVPDATPSTKYAKGVTTGDAVAANLQPALFDLLGDGSGDIVESPWEEGADTPNEVEDDAAIPVWYLLFRLTPEAIIVELSFPNETELEGTSARNVWITSWVERIIPVPVDRGDMVQDLPDEDDGDEFEVAVSPR